VTGRAFRCLFFLAGLAAILLPAVCRAGDRVLRISDRQVITFARMIDEVQGARALFIGESHDDMAHHRAQLRIIRALQDKGVSLAIGMEMFAAASQPDLDRWLAGRMQGGEFVYLYTRNWQMPWPLYRDILLFARRHQLPLVGLNIPRSVTEKVARDGFAALSPTERSELPPDITCNVEPSYMAFIREAFASHPGGIETFRHFCEAQLLWNRSMARHIAAFLARQPAKNMVVICGVGHALKRGIPAELQPEGSFSYRVILPEIPSLAASRLTAEDADYLLLEK
jgi:uncharacterized iron-regulated protein